MLNAPAIEIDGGVSTSLAGQDRVHPAQRILATGRQHSVAKRNSSSSLLIVSGIRSHHVSPGRSGASCSGVIVGHPAGRFSISHRFRSSVVCGVGYSFRSGFGSPIQPNCTESPPATNIAKAATPATMHKKVFVLTKRITAPPPDYCRGTYRDGWLDAQRAAEGSRAKPRAPSALRGRAYVVMFGGRPTERLNFLICH